MIKRGDGWGTVYLSSTELKLFNFLKQRSADSSNWPSLDEIQTGLKLPSLNTKKLIASLKKKEGIVLHSRTIKEKQEKKVTYGLSPETLEVLVRKEISISEKHKPKDFIYKILYLGEPCFGTKAFDEKYTMKGLALFLEVNGHANDLNQVIIQGGVIPHVPPYSSKSYINDLRFLGYVNRKGKEKNISEELLEQKLENEFEEAFYEEHVNNDERKKITNLTDAFSAAEEALMPLMDVLPSDTVLRIQFGEEDRKNVEHIENAYIKALAKEKKGQIKAMKEEAADEAQNLYKKSACITLEKLCLETSLKGKKLERRKGEKEDTYYKRTADILTEKVKEVRSQMSDFWNDFEGLNLDLAEKEYAGIIENAIMSFYKKRKKERKDNIKKLNKDLTEVEKQKRDLKSKLEDLSASMSWTEELLSGSRSSITWFTRQYPIFADGAEVVWKKAKDRYTAHFFDWNIGQPMVVHVSPRKNIKLETEVVEDVRTGKKSEAEVEYQIIHGEKKILLVSNLRHIFSNSVSPGDIRDAKLEMHYQNMVLKKLFDEELKDQPDIMLLGAHSTGGFRVMPWFKDSDQFIDGEFVKDKEISYLIKLPTLQSVPKLEWLVGKNFRNWHTKNYKGGPHASAAILHSENKDGVNKFEVVDTNLLMKFGKISEEIEDFRKKLKEKLPEKKRKEILDLIKKKRELVRANFEKIEAAGDFHLGSPDYKERCSKDQLIKAYQIYQEEHGLPQVVSWDEVLHGVEDRIFKGSARYDGLIPEKFYQSVIVPILESNMPGEEKAKQIAKEALRNQRAITIHNDSEQKHLFALLLKPYAEKIIAQGGQLVLTSGNHYNKSQPTSDEAIELSNQFPEVYKDNKKIHVFSGKGNSFGMGTMYLPGKQKLFVMHKFPERMDEVYGIMTHLRKMNNDSDIVIAGDRHQPGAGYADAHLIVEHPGFETINKYVPQIGKPPDRRGIININYDPKKRGLYEVEFVLGNTLEKIVDRENII